MKKLPVVLLVLIAVSWPSLRVRYLLFVTFQLDFVVAQQQQEQPPPSQKGKAGDRILGKVKQMFGGIMNVIMTAVLGPPAAASNNATTRYK